jgi:transposase
MKKEEIRKEFFKLRIKHHSYTQCRKILKAMYGYEISLRTLYRWSKRLNETEWNLKDSSKRPKTIHTKVTQKDREKIISIRNKTGWCADKIKNFVNLSHTTINKVLQENNLTASNSRRKKRLKYIRWQRKHPNSLWQMDVSDQKIKDKYCFAVIDDCSRYCVGLIDLNRVTTAVARKF